MKKNKKHFEKRNNKIKENSLMNYKVKLLHQVI